MREFLIGKLDKSSLPHDIFMIGGSLSFIFLGLAVIGILTYLRRWKWLWNEWLTSVDPKKIGIMYFLAGGFMLARGGVDALMVWLQQATSVDGSHGYLSADHFQQIFTAHGNIMVFFVAMAFIFGLINYIVPLQIGARDLASPFLNTLGFWLYIAGVVMVNMFFFAGGEYAALLVGMGLVIGSGCVVNNYIDRGIDKKMARTHKRALVTGKISGREALIYATVLCAIGFGLLIAFTNALTVYAGLVGLIFYVIIYGIGKRKTVWGTVIGSVSGAIPITAGYLAVSNTIDGAAILLFLAMVCWQMPHFYAIAMYRLDDYKAAGIPVLPAVRGMRHTKLKIMAYIIAFAVVCASLTIQGYTGITFFIISLLVSLVWLWKGYTGYISNTDIAWAKRMFLFSLIVLLVFSFLLAFDWLLP